MIILIQCTDQVGLVAAISKVMADAAFNIISMREYVNVEANRFYLRVEIADSGFNAAHIEDQLQKVLPAGSTVFINTAVKKKWPSW